MAFQLATSGDELTKMMAVLPARDRMALQTSML
jgi:hypothetical protein